MIACIGDIVGRPGREAVAHYLPSLKERYGIDFVVANGENASHGYGLTRKNAEALFASGIDVLTGGNHSFDKKEILTFIDEMPVLRPINYPKTTPGKGIGIYRVGGFDIAVVNVMGHFAMPICDNPFAMIKGMLGELKQKGIAHIVVDMHAEASAEKYAMLRFIGEDVSVLFGTHTHVGTDDLHIVDGCAYVSDVGLSGCRDGVIGMDAEVPLRRFVSGIGGHFDIPKRCKAIFQMIVCKIDSKGKAIGAKKIMLRDDQLSEFDAFCEA